MALKAPDADEQLPVRIHRYVEPRFPGEARQDFRKRIEFEIASRIHAPQGEIGYNWSEAQHQEFIAPEPPIGSKEERVQHLSQATAAADRIIEALEKKERILIFGDFDCDGVCSVVQLRDYLIGAADAPALVSWFIPNRFKHDYGLTAEALKECIGIHSPTLLIAVDCGTNSIEEIRTLREQQSIDTVVLDHHLLYRDNVNHPARALVNARACPEAKSKFPGLWDLCASGLVFLFCEWLNSRRPSSTWSRERSLILAGLATCADVVPVLRINRALVKHAIRLCNSDSLGLVPGLQQLDKLFKQERLFGSSYITEGTFGYNWGPSLNANGRIAHARTSVRLLIAKSPRRINALAQRTFQNNEKRKRIEDRILESAREQAEAQVNDPHPAKVLLVTGIDWHVGVVGIVATRLRDIYSRPAIVCGLADASRGIWRGSARSVPPCVSHDGFDLGAAIGAARIGTQSEPALLLSGGGHPMAAGLKFTESQRAKFRKWINDRCHIPPTDLVPNCEVPAFAENLMPTEWGEVIRNLRPFGMGNPEFPLLAVNARLQKARIIHGQIQDPAKLSSRTISRKLHPALMTEDQIDIDKLVQRLMTRENTVESLVWDRLKPNLQSALQNGLGKEPDVGALKAGIAAALNEIIFGYPIYEEGRFTNIELSARSQFWLSVGLGRTRAASLNRFLLEDSLGAALSRSPDFHEWRAEAEFALHDRVRIEAMWRKTEDARLKWRIGGEYILKLRIPRNLNGDARFELDKCWNHPRDGIPSVTVVSGRESLYPRRDWLEEF